MLKGHHLSICYIVPTYAPDEASHMAHLPRFLSEVGKYCDVHVVIQHGSGQPRIANVRSVYVQQPGNHFHRALELIRIAYRLRRQGCRKFFVRISASAALELGLISRFLGLQIYYWVSGQGKNMKPPWRRGIRRRIYYELSNWLLYLNIRLAYRFVTGPESMLDYFESNYGIHPKKTIILYNDIDPVAMKLPNSLDSKETLRRELGLPTPRFVLLFVGRVSSLKGGEYLIPIAHLLEKRVPEALLIVVGQVHIPGIVEHARLQGLTNIVFVGSIPNKGIVKYYKIADIFIMPSNSEGFPRVLLEAMACGLPIVAFDVGGVRDIVHLGQLPFVVPRGDVEGLVDKALMLLNNHDLRAEQAKLGLYRVKRYSTERVARMFVERIVFG